MRVVEPELLRKRILSLVTSLRKLAGGERTYVIKDLDLGYIEKQVNRILDAHLIEEDKV